jgi:hypothetical protein
MRRILIVLLLIIVTMSILWIVAGRQISMFVDRFASEVTILEPTSYVAYQGTGDGGTLIIGEHHRLSLAPLNPHVGLTKDNQLAIAANGKVFALGPLQSSENDTLEADALDNAPSFRQKQSYLVFPTFGPVLHLNRPEYCEYVLTSRSGQRLSMLWSVDPAAHTSSLIRIDISNVAR